MKMKHQNSRQVVLEHVTPLIQGHDGVFMIVIDGKSGTGKSTLAKQLAEVLDASLIKCDDFYAGGDLSYWKTLTTAEKNDRVINWRRIKTEALVPLTSGKAASWKPFGSSKVVVSTPKSVVILEGAYSSRKELNDFVNFKILVETPEDLRENRIREREGSGYDEEWHALWKPAMDYYFEVTQPRSSFDLVISTND